MVHHPEQPREAPEVNVTDIVFPSEANTLGVMFGGRVMAEMDKAAFLAAVEFARVPFVTVSCDGIRFLSPIQVGDIIETRARVAHVARSSVVVKVEVYAQHPYTTEPPIRATRAWFALAARDAQGHAIRLPPLRVETDEQRADERLAIEFRERSKAVEMDSSG